MRLRPTDRSQPRSGASPCWVRAASGTAGYRWARAVTAGMRESQVAALHSPPQPRRRSSMGPGSKRSASIMRTAAPGLANRAPSCPKQRFTAVTNGQLPRSLTCVTTCHWAARTVLPKLAVRVRSLRPLHPKRRSTACCPLVGVAGQAVQCPHGAAGSTHGAARPLAPTPHCWATATPARAANSGGA